LEARQHCTARPLASGGLHQALDGVRRDLDVGVGGNDPFGVGALHTSIHGRAEAEVLLRGDEVGPGIAFAHQFGRSIRGGVVDHHDLGRTPRRRVGKRFQATREQLPRVPRHDGDGYLRLHRAPRPSLEGEL
jgi:hypothetical protein